MRTVSTTALLVASASLAAGFSNTHPLVAWSSQPLSALSLLSPSHPSNTPKSPFSSTQQPLIIKDDSLSSSDLCSLDLLLLISTPGLHISDLSFLPSASSSPLGLRASLSHAKQHGSTSSHPYLPSRRASTAQKVAERFVKECGATVETQERKNVWGGEGGKVLRVEQAEVGLGEWELVGKPAREGRAAAMSALDEIASHHLAALASSGAKHAIILTSLPSSSLAALESLANLKHKPEGHEANLKKRQFVSEEDPSASEQEEQEEEQEQASWDDLEESSTAGVKSVDVDVEEESDEELAESSWGSKPLVVVTESAFKPNQTSIFEVPKNAGLLHRYVFFTPALIFGLLISLLLLIPVVLIGSQTLTSVQTLQGLEGKMVGAVSGVSEGKSS